MKNFKFFEQHNEQTEWTGATWFWECGGMDGNLSIDRTDTRWVLNTKHCMNGLLEFLRTFDNNRIIPIMSLFFNNHWYKPPFNDGLNFHTDMLNHEIVVVYYDYIETN